MTPFRPTSHDRPGEQISTTPSGLKVTSAKRLMVDSMVRMIQKSEPPRPGLHPIPLLILDRKCMQPV